MIDTHCHVLPSVDDGPKSWDLSLELCAKAVADGVTHIVATPHCNHLFAYDRHHCQDKLDELRERFPSCGFSLGCELMISEKNLAEAARYPERYTFDQTNLVLIEFSEFEMPASSTHALSELISLGLSPIIAHPERYPIVQRNPDLLEEWIGFGCISAITAPSLLGVGGQIRKKLCELLLKRNLVHIIASDAHDPTRRPPILSTARKAAAKIVGEKRAGAFVAGNPRELMKTSEVACT